MSLSGMPFLEIPILRPLRLTAKASDTLYYPRAKTGPLVTAQLHEGSRSSHNQQWNLVLWTLEAEEPHDIV